MQKGHHNHGTQPRIPGLRAFFATELAIAYEEKTTYETFMLFHLRHLPARWGGFCPK